MSFTIQKYWQLNLSVLLLNVIRGGFAEYLVLCALDKVMPDALSQVKSGMEECDIDGPEISLSGEKRRSRIEVKSTATVQLTSPDGVEIEPLPDSRLTFSIRKSTTEKDPDPKRHNDLYVFCHYKATRKSDNIMNLDLWDFYVYPTYLIEENESISEQKTISIWRLRQLGVQPHGFDTLCQAILDVQKQIEEHYNNRLG